MVVTRPRTRAGDKTAFTVTELCELYLAEGIAHKKEFDAP